MLHSSSHNLFPPFRPSFFSAPGNWSFVFFHDDGTLDFILFYFIPFFTGERKGGRGGVEGVPENTGD